MNINPASIAIVSITSYPAWYQGKLRSIKHTDKIRGDLALKSADIGIKKGYHVVVSDWNSSKTFQKKLRNTGCTFIKRRSHKRSPAKRQTMLHASKISGIQVIVLTELEKVSLIQDCIPTIVTPILEGKAEIVIPKRNEALFKTTYPFYQYESETEGNAIYNEELKSHKLLNIDDELIDMFFGPRVLANSPRVLRLFTKQFMFNLSNITFPKWYLDSEELSNILFFPIVRALKKNFRIINVEVPFSYPTMQKKNENFGARELFLLKRKMQRISLIVELLHFVSYLENYHGLRIKAINKKTNNTEK